MTAFPPSGFSLFPLGTNFASQVNLTQVRKEIDRKNEYKYSSLILLFADLVREGKLDPEDLRGLSEEKLRHIRRYADQSAA